MYRKNIDVLSKEQKPGRKFSITAKSFSFVLEGGWAFQHVLDKKKFSDNIYNSNGITKTNNRAFSVEIINNYFQFRRNFAFVRNIIH